MAEEKQTTEACGEKHFYGGQAVIEGVMMRGLDRYAVAVRREDGEVVMAEKPITPPDKLPQWRKWPLIRGNVGLVEGLTLGWQTLQFSADVLAQEEKDKLKASQEILSTSDTAEVETEPVVVEKPAAKTKAKPVKEEPQGISRVAMVLTSVVSGIIAICLFILLPTYAVDWTIGKGAEGVTMPYWSSVMRNLFEGGLRLLVIIGYVSLVSLMPYVRRVFMYHGAEHATINCFEAGVKVTVENVLGFSPLHPRCGTAFLLVVVIVKIILGCFFGWPPPLIRGLIRIALIPIVAGIAYEVIRWAGRNRNSILARILAAPGMMMQVLTTRKPTPDQVEIAIHALSAVACEVDLPENMTPAKRIGIPFGTDPEQVPAEVQA